MARDRDGKYYPTSGSGWKQPKGERPVSKPKVIRPTGRLYWAYGSNLCVEHMARRCPAAEMVGPLTVDSAALVFRGVADVVARRGRQVQGGLWRITDECERALDQYEGVVRRLYMKRYLPLPDGGECMFYQMRTRHGIMPPSEVYVEIIARGYQDFGLDLAGLDVALAESWSRKEVTPTLHERHRKRGRPTLARIAPRS